MPVQRRPGAQERIDLAFLWPSLTPPDPAHQAAAVGAPVDPNERLFVTIAAGDGTLPLIERVQTIYPRYLAAEPVAGPDGLTLQRLSRRHALSGRGPGLRVRRRPSISCRAARARAASTPACACTSGGSATPTSRCAFRATGSSDWRSVADGIDRLIARLQPDAE